MLRRGGETLERGLNRALAADELRDIAIAQGFGDEDEIQGIIADAFVHIERDEVPELDLGEPEQPRYKFKVVNGRKPPPQGLGEWNAGGDPGMISPQHRGRGARQLHPARPRQD